MKTDIEIALSSEKKHITEIAKKLNIHADDLELYGKDKAKVVLNKTELTPKEENLVLVTAINPTRAGEGKSTITVGLTDALAAANKSVVACLREPSLGPVFGLKGGATGGGMAQVNPMEDINLHFTGDMHAITTANNLIAACLDNHIHQGNELNIDLNKIVFKRVLDMNDRSLRDITIGQGSHVNGVERKDGFQITVASEVMAILCLAKDLEDFKVKVSEIIVAYTEDDKVVTVKDLGIEGALALVMKDAIKPNLVQTLEHTPVLMHGGPFANIAHGCNSLMATRMGLSLADYVVTEAGFGADLGSEKFVDIKSRMGGIKPKAIVLVATIRALKLHGGVDQADLANENVEALEAGLENLAKHIDTVKQYGVNYVVAINKFVTDSEAEVKALFDWCEANNHPVVESDVWEKGSAGGQDLANAVIKACETSTGNLNYIYELEDTFEEKLNKIITKVYGGSGFELTDTAKAQLEQITKNGYGDLPVCMAKTPASLTDDPSKIGAPKDFKITISEIKVSAGAGFLVVLTGKVLVMPGLPKVPAANKMNIDNKGVITGLF